MNASRRLIAYFEGHFESADDTVLSGLNASGLSALGASTRGLSGEACRCGGCGGVGGGTGP